MLFRSELYHALKPATSGSLVMAIILLIANQFIFKQPGLIWLLIEIICGGLIYYAMMFFLFRKTLDEVKGHIF